MSTNNQTQNPTAPTTVTATASAGAETASTATETKFDGEWVKKTREKLNLTQQEFCAKVQVSQGLVSQVEKGRTPVSKKFKAKIEALLASN